MLRIRSRWHYAMDAKCSTHPREIGPLNLQAIIVFLPDEQMRMRVQRNATAYGQSITDKFLPEKGKTTIINLPRSEVFVLHCNRTENKSYRLILSEFFLQFSALSEGRLLSGLYRPPVTQKLQIACSLKLFIGIYVSMVLRSLGVISFLILRDFAAAYDDARRCHDSFHERCSKRMEVRGSMLFLPS